MYNNSNSSQGHSRGDHRVPPYPPAQPQAPPPPHPRRPTHHGPHQGHSGQVYRVVEQVAYAQPVQPPQPVYYNPDVVPLPASSSGSGGAVNSVDDDRVVSNVRLSQVIQKKLQSATFNNSICVLSPVCFEHTVIF